jgi:hypothetical protein
MFYPSKLRIGWIAWRIVVLGLLVGSAFAISALQKYQRAQALDKIQQNRAPTPLEEFDFVSPSGVKIVYPNKEAHERFLFRMKRSEKR